MEDDGNPRVDGPIRYRSQAERVRLFSDCRTPGERGR